MTNLTPEMIEKAKSANSAEGLLDLAKENGIEMTEEEAKKNFAHLHPQSGELSDDELDNVAGGGCNAGDGRLIVTVNWKCHQFVCKHCGNHDDNYYRASTLVSLGATDETIILKCKKCGGYLNCNNCKYCTYEKGLWLCNHESNRK